MNCSICKRRIPIKHGYTVYKMTGSYGWDKGNNAQHDNDGRCCDPCNDTVVLPARLRAIFKGEVTIPWKTEI